MEIKGITKEVFESAGGHSWGSKQAIVAEFLNGTNDYAEVLNYDGNITAWQSSYNNAAKRMKVDTYATQRNGRLFIVRGRRHDQG